MSQKVGKNNNKVYRLVLTGGPCGGKTTGQARLCTFFENLGWKVYRVPETNTVLMGGGVKWTDMSEEEVFKYQENLIKTMMQIETTFFDLASTCQQNCLVICDRGAMDASAYLKPEQWERMKKENSWNNVDLRDNRYNQVIHMVSAAKGAELFYQTDSNAVRYEDVDFARTLDDITSQAWVGHPYYDVIDNTTDFEKKMVRTMAAVCNRLGVDSGDRLSLDSRKKKFLVAKLPDEADYPQFQDFIVVHDYLVTPNSAMQARIRKRGQSVKMDQSSGRFDFESGDTGHDWPLEDNRRVPPYLSSCIALDHRDRSSEASLQKITSKAPINNLSKNQLKFFVFGDDKDLSNWTYTHTIRRPKINEEAPELKMQITIREYELLLAQKDITHYTIFKKRRCFLWNNQYFQMDIYQDPCPQRCRGLIILETYTSQLDEELKLPDFLDIEKQITDEPQFSMYNLSKKPASAIHNRVRSASEGENLCNTNYLNGHKKGSPSKKHSVAIDGRDAPKIIGEQRVRFLNGSTNDICMSTDTSEDSS